MQVGKSIRWGQIKIEDYAYGSQIVLENPDHIHFKNTLMPSGERITSWSSRSVFQTTKDSAKLPLLTRGESYQLIFQGKTVPEGSIFFKISFFDYYGGPIEEYYLRTPSDYFTVPDTYNYYEIALHHGGCLSLDFNQIILVPYVKEQSMEVEKSYWIHSRAKSNYLIFDELGNGPQVSSLWKSSSQFTYMTSTLTNGHLYLRESAHQLIDQIFSNNPHLIFVGYGPISNLAALYHAERLGARAYITEDVLTESAYTDLQASLNITSRLNQGIITYRDLVKSHVKVYAQGLIKGSEWGASLLLDYKPQLEYLISESESNAEI
ncbi:accessory Sec system protein Asp3 [Aerococcus sp. Group 1]|uniref:accessory Sec system protein Asp3 n=1 Tax=Aerococcus urinae (strain CCUG 59500 / ACS-120-V-Col10a) TaxID=2976812 RepID=UPI00227CA124|nr:accessory Sec system protein Asp3 [Aerococcus sp. Group 1]MCY3031111.1 accessory Sec system protein Asp3 [Aerococcus sp. Group 1]MCY3054253.1 accessory Sec system protein Asp3 [Aerococcus sp. Group 1]MCY3055983.1 accessory Sec system protein Asp3 [Aerococcus sp. Group 1]MCY3061871.1 accessory Sec system protein Asp3 [Aerococcus sp. Group 1]